MASTVLTTSALVARGAVWLNGVVVLASSTGGDVTVYDGMDAGGRKVGVFKGEGNISRPVPFWPPILCEIGLYVAIGSSITEVLVHWDPA